MKWKPDKQQIRWGVTIVVSAVCVLLFYYLLFHGGKLAAGLDGLLHAMMSVVYGIVIAYVLSPILHFIEKRVFAPHYRKRGIDLHAPEAERERLRMRKWALFLTMILFLLILAVLLMVIIPQLIKSVQSIVVSFPTYIGNITKLSNTYFADHPDVARTVDSYLDQASDWITDFVNNTLMPQVTFFIRRLSQSVVAFVRGIFNFIIGTIVAVYLLNSKEKFKSGAKKLIYAFFREDFANELLSGARFAHYTFSGFLVGKLVDSAIIGIIAWVGAKILNTPYPVLMAVIVGVTNIIPFFGPYIGEIATLVLLLLIDPLAALVFFIFLIILQQFDGNILGPKILGNSTGLSSFWVIFSVLFFGSIFGVAGWILGVPIFAILYAFIRRLADHFLRRKKLPTQADVYGDTAYVEKGEVILKKDADWDLYHVRHPQSIWRRIFRIRKDVGDGWRAAARSGGESEAAEERGNDT